MFVNRFNGILFISDFNFLDIYVISQMSPENVSVSMRYKMFLLNPD